MERKHCSFMSIVIMIIKSSSFIKKSKQCNIILRLDTNVTCHSQLTLYIWSIDSVFSNEYHDFK